MKFEMKMPDLATTDSPIKVLKWLKEPGQPVKRGEIVLEVETDKAAMEVEATVDGIWVETRAEAGAEVGSGEVIAIIETAKTEPAPESKPSEPSKSSQPNPPAKPSKPDKGMFARNRAAAPGEAAAQSLSPARRTAARRLVESKQTIPHFYLQTSVNAEAMSRRREASGPVKPAWDAFFVKAVSTAMKTYNQMACRFQDDQLIPHQAENIGVAVDVDGDLFVVAVSDPSAKTVEQISQEIRKLVTELRSGDPQARKMTPGVMTISNLGSANVESFTAIINPPESAILAIGKIMPVVVPAPDGGFAVEKRVNLTLSVDHRVANGRYAADFLGAIVKEIENL